MIRIKELREITQIQRASNADAYTATDSETSKYLTYLQSKWILESNCVTLIRDSATFHFRYLEPLLLFLSRRKHGRTKPFLFCSFFLKISLRLLLLVQWAHLRCGLCANRTRHVKLQLPTWPSWKVATQARKNVDLLGYPC